MAFSLFRHASGWFFVVWFFILRKTMPFIYECFHSIIYCSICQNRNLFSGVLSWNELHLFLSVNVMPTKDTIFTHLIPRWNPPPLPKCTWGLKYPQEQLGLRHQRLPQEGSNYRNHAPPHVNGSTVHTLFKCKWHRGWSFPSFSTFHAKVYLHCTV